MSEGLRPRMERAPPSRGAAARAMGALGIMPRREIGARALLWLFVLGVAALVLYPLLELIRQPLGDIPGLWREALDEPGLADSLLNTVLLAAGSMAMAVTVAMVLAWCRAGLSGRAGAVAQVVAVLPLVIPPLAGVTGWAFLLSPRVGYLNLALRELPGLDRLESGPFDAYTLPWIVIITGIYLVPYAFVFIQAGLSHIDPRLEDAARSAGSGWWGAQFRVVLPLLRPALVYGGIVVALLALGQFTAPLLLGRSQGIDVLTTQLYLLTAAPPPNYPLAMFISLPILFIALAGVAAQRRALGDSFRFVAAGKGAARHRGSNTLLLLPVILYCFVLVVPPLVSLVLVAISPYWGAPLEATKVSLNAFREVLADPISLQAIWNAVRYSAVATIACLALSLGAALVALRTTGAPRRVIDYVVNTPIAVPALLFGMGILIAIGLGPLNRFMRNWFGIPLYGSGSVIVLAYVVLLLPHGTRLLMSGLAQINPQLEAAARIFGSTATGTVFRILMPLLRRNLVSAAMLMFVLASHEFAASSLLAGPDTQVMSTVLYGQWDTGTYPRVAALALVMVAIAVLGLSVIVLFDRPSERRGRRVEPAADRPKGGFR